MVAKKITVELPKKFDFHQTIHLIQRGIDDPINHIQAGKFIRCYQINDHLVLVQTEFDKKSNTLGITSLSDSVPRDALVKAVSLTLGLDDPLLQNYDLKIPHKKKLEPYWGISVPGYTGYFEALVQTIFGQQVSVAVANRMRTKFTKTFGTSIHYHAEDYYVFPSAKIIAVQSPNALRKLGMSQTKSKSIIALAKELAEGNLENEIRATLDTDILRKRLQALHGIGCWTVDWFMLRALRQFEVIATTDLAVRKAFSWWAEKKTLLTSEEINKYAKRLRPYGGALSYRILSAYKASLHHDINPE